MLFTESWNDPAYKETTGRRVTAFPCAHTQGDNVEAALRNAREVIELELGYLIDKGLSIPPSDSEEARLERVTVRLSALRESCETKNARGHRSV